MKPEYIAAVFGLIGTIVGAAAAIITTWVQQHNQNKREATRLAAEMGFKDYSHDLALAQQLEGETRVRSLTLYMAYHAELMRLVQEEEVTKENLEALWDKYDGLAKLAGDLDCPISKEDPTTESNATSGKPR